MAPLSTKLQVTSSFVLLSSLGVALWGWSRFTLRRSRETRDKIDDDNAANTESPSNLVREIIKGTNQSDLDDTVLVVLKDRALQDTKLALEAANNTIANLRISIRFVRAQLAGPLSRLPAAYVGVQPRSLGSIQDGLHAFWNSDLDLSADGIATLHDFDGFHVALPFILSDLPNCKVSLFCSGDDVISIDLFGAEPTKRPFFVTGVRHLHNLHPGEAQFFTFMDHFVCPTTTLSLAMIRSKLSPISPVSRSKRSHREFRQAWCGIGRVGLPPSRVHVRPSGRTLRRGVLSRWAICHVHSAHRPANRSHQTQVSLALDSRLRHVTILSRFGVPPDNPQTIVVCFYRASDSLRS